ARAARSYTTVRYRDDDLLVFGGESRGLPPAIRAAHADATFGIPIASEQVRSLNLANAVAIVLYEGLRQRGKLGRPPARWRSRSRCGWGRPPRRRCGGARRITPPTRTSA